LFCANYEWYGYPTIVYIDVSGPLVTSVCLSPSMRYVLVGCKDRGGVALYRIRFTDSTLIPVRLRSPMQPKSAFYVTDVSAIARDSGVVIGNAVNRAAFVPLSSFSWIIATEAPAPPAIFDAMV